MKFSLKITTFLAFVILFGTLSGGFASRNVWVRQHFFSSVSADDGEVEIENEGQKATTTPQTSTTTTTQSTSVQTKQVIENVVEYKPVTKTINVTPEEYLKDSDGDGLVDALDPNPYIEQSEFFTDTDGDGVPNAFDRHHDEDDFVFFDDLETDTNNNGILDSYEQQ
jgi:hypothetical protein